MSKNATDSTGLYIVIWAFAATIATLILFSLWTSADNRWDKVMGEQASYTIEDVLKEAEYNNDITEKIVEDYDKLSRNAQEECNIIGSYFGDEASNLCFETVFNDVDVDISTGDLTTSAREGMRSQLEDALNPQSRD